MRSLIAVAGALALTALPAAADAAPTAPNARTGPVQPLHRAFTCEGTSTKRTAQELQVGGIICRPVGIGPILGPFTIESPRGSQYRCQRGFAGNAPVVGIFVAGRDCQQIHP